MCSAGAAVPLIAPHLLLFIIECSGKPSALLLSCSLLVHGGNDGCVCVSLYAL